MVGTIHGQNFGFAASQTSHLDSVFVGVSTTVAEEYTAHAFWSFFNDSLSESSTDAYGLTRSDEAELFSLFFDGIDDVLVAMTKVHVNELGAHVIVFLAIVIPEIDTFRLFNRDNLSQFLLSGPGMHVVLVVHFENFFTSKSRQFVSH